MSTFTLTQVDDGSEGYYELSAKNYFGNSQGIVRFESERELLYFILDTYFDVSFEFDFRKEEK